jgi:hypothetical protein
LSFCSSTKNSIVFVFSFRFPFYKIPFYKKPTMSASAQFTGASEVERSVEQHDGGHNAATKGVTFPDPEKHDLTTSAATTTDDEAPGPLTERERHEAQLQQWNHPRVNLWRVLTTMWCFILMGMNDGAIGALIPYVSEMP